MVVFEHHLPGTEPGETALQKAVGTSIVGFGTSSCLLPPTLGIQANVNIVYGVHELDVYDPLTPQQLYTSWTDATGRYPLPIGPSGIPEAEITMFCPVVRTTATARLFGVGFVLEPHRPKGPPAASSTRRWATRSFTGSRCLGGHHLPTGDHGTLPPVDRPRHAGGRVLPQCASWKVVTNASSPQVLRLRLTDVPGWNASIDGKPLQLVRFNRIMLQAKIPPGDHTIELHYWPETFTAGIVWLCSPPSCWCSPSYWEGFGVDSHDTDPLPVRLHPVNPGMTHAGTTARRAQSGQPTFRLLDATKMSANPITVHPATTSPAVKLSGQ